MELEPVVRMELEQAWAARREWEPAAQMALEPEPEPGWVVRMEREQEPAVRMEWEQEQEQEQGQEPGWVVRMEPREIPFLAALAAPCFPAATQAQT